MAIEYNMELSTSEQPFELATVLARELHTDAPSTNDQGVSVVETPDATFFLSSSDSVGRQAIMEAYGFLPAVSVWIRLCPLEDVPQFSFVLSCFRALLHLIAGDAVALYAGEIPILLRQRGTLSLNSDYPGFEQVREAFELAHVPFATQRIAQL